MPSKTTSPLTLRLSNKDIEALEIIRELGGFSSRGECIRALLEPTLVQARTAIETKSVVQASVAKVKAEITLNKHIKKMADAADEQMTLPDVEVSIA